MKKTTGLCLCGAVLLLAGLPQTADGASRTVRGPDLTRTVRKHHAIRLVGGSANTLHKEYGRIALSASSGGNVIDMSSENRTLAQLNADILTHAKANAVLGVDALRDSAKRTLERALSPETLEYVVSLQSGTRPVDRNDGKVVSLGNASYKDGPKKPLYKATHKRVKRLQVRSWVESKEGTADFVKLSAVGAVDVLVDADLQTFESHPQVMQQRERQLNAGKTRLSSETTPHEIEVVTKATEVWVFPEAEAIVEELTATPLQ